MRTASAKGNNARKILSFYRINFGCEPPYQVLVDGDTIHTSLSNDLYLKQALHELLGSATHITVTACIVNELRAKGESHSGASLFAKRASRIPCAHDGQKSASDCIVSRLQTPHDKKLMLASTDASLLKLLSDTAGIPHISIMNNSKFVLKAPSHPTLLHVEKTQSDKMLILSQSDQVLVNKVHDAERAEREARRRGRKKRKRAKGPNPLSIQKSKKKLVQDDSAPIEEKVPETTRKETESQPEKTGRKRSRKRRRNGNQQSDDKDTELPEGQNQGETDTKIVSKDVIPTRKRRRRGSGNRTEAVSTNERAGTRAETNGNLTSGDELSNAVANATTDEVKAVVTAAEKASDGNYGSEQNEDIKQKLKSNRDGRDAANVSGPSLLQPVMKDSGIANDDGYVKNTDGQISQIRSTPLASTAAPKPQPESVRNAIEKKATESKTKEIDLAARGENISEPGDRKKLKDATDEIEAENANTSDVAKDILATGDNSGDNEVVEASDPASKKKHRKNRRRRPKKATET